MTAGERDKRSRELLPLVSRMARGLYRVYKVGEYGDYFQVGCVGMMRAIACYDPARGVPLEAYARPHIAGAILNGVRSRDPLSENARNLLRTAERERYRMAHERREVPTMREMANRISGLGGALLLAHRSTTVSLDVSLPKGESVPVDWNDDPSRIVETRDRAARLRRAISQLTARQRDVLELHYYRDKTIEVVGEALSISPQRVSQLHHCALAHVRKALVNA